MTNSQPLEDITPRLDDIDSRLDQLGDELDLVRTIQEGVRRETRYHSQSLTRLDLSLNIKAFCPLPFFGHYSQSPELNK